MAQVSSSTVHDVVIIGSGAGGGTVTKVLADLGVRVSLHKRAYIWKTYGAQRTARSRAPVYACTKRSSAAANSGACGESSTLAR